MRQKNPETAKRIISYVDSFFEQNQRTPSLREIAQGTGIPRDTARRYLLDLNQAGKLHYDGKRILTDSIAAMLPSRIRRIPIAGTVTCGEFRQEEEMQTDFLELPAEMLGEGKYFALIADGDSMHGAGIDQGDLVIVRRAHHAQYGQIVVALDDEGRNTLKTLLYSRQKGRAYLHPENPDFPDIYPEELSIQGVAEKVIKSLP